jgi:CRISPR-associated protein Cas2
MQYVICYDIGDDRRRTRVAAALLDFGTRVQESVFVAHLDEELAGRMRERLTGLVDATWDRVHVFEVCEACGKRVWGLGSAEVVRDADWYVV